MNKNMMSLLLILLFGFGGLFGAIYFLGSKNRRIGEMKPYVVGRKLEEIEHVSNATQTSSSIQQELDDVASKLTSDMRAEARLNLNMLGQLRAYHEMVGQLDGIARDVNRNMEIIEEITKEEFQQNVKLQASLFAGKKPALVAKHMEEFSASRVGAILAKMKPKEASVVLDTWAEKKDPRVSAFYREVMAAYLNNKRYDANPKLFDQVSMQEVAEAEAVQ